MKLKYFVAGKVFEIELGWFTDDCANEEHEVWTAIEQCAKNYYEMDDGWDDARCKFPAEIALCIDNREIGRETVEIDFEPVFQCT